MLCFTILFPRHHYSPFPPWTIDSSGLQISSPEGGWDAFVRDNRLFVVNFMVNFVDRKCRIHPRDLSKRSGSLSDQTRCRRNGFVVSFVVKPGDEGRKMASIQAFFPCVLSRLLILSSPAGKVPSGEVVLRESDREQPTH